MKQRLSGQCLCGAVRFRVKNSFRAFYQCHCKQCQKITGSAFASNMPTDPDNIEWLQGEDQITRFVHPERDFTKAFCRHCGSGVPYINKHRTALVIPAGSLDDAPDSTPDANIFMAEQAPWLKSGQQAKEYEGFAS